MTIEQLNKKLLELRENNRILKEQIEVPSLSVHDIWKLKEFVKVNFEKRVQIRNEITYIEYENRRTRNSIK